MNYFLSTLSDALLKVEFGGPSEFKMPSIGPSYRRIYLIGNGGSAAIAAHMANDLTKMGHQATSLSEPSTLTAIANDDGYQWVYARQLEFKGWLEDHLIVISSSGESENLVRAIMTAKSRGIYNILTFTGFEPNNQIRRMGLWNWYVPSKNYGIVECAHQALLHAIINPGLLDSRKLGDGLSTHDAPGGSLAAIGTIRPNPSPDTDRPADSEKGAFKRGILSVSGFLGIGGQDSTSRKKNQD